MRFEPATSAQPGVKDRQKGGSGAALERQWVWARHPTAVWESVRCAPRDYSDRQANEGLPRASPSKKGSVEALGLEADLGDFAPEGGKALGHRVGAFEREAHVAEAGQRRGRHGEAVIA